MAGSGFFNFLNAVQPSGVSVGKLKDPLDDKEAAKLTENKEEMNIHMDYKNPLVYPNNLFEEGQEAYIFFVIRDSVSQSNTVFKRIALYMPPSVKVNYGTQWEDLSMTANQYTDLAKDMSSMGDIEGIKNGFNTGGVVGAATGALQTPAGMLGARSVTNAVDGAFGSTMGQQLETYTGTTVNPHMALTFKGVNFREFQFDFIFMPRNEGESESVRKIIKCFKAAMHPANNAAQGSRYWAYPFNFDIYLLTPTHKYMFNIATSVLTSMAVDYNGSGYPVFFRNTGAPVQINMSLSFKELEVLTRERVLQDY